MKERDPRAAGAAEEEANPPKKGLLSKVKRLFGRGADEAETRNNYPLF